MIRQDTTINEDHIKRITIIEEYGFIYAIDNQLIYDLEKKHIVYFRKFKAT